jgi:hypothetical protein
MATIHFTVSTTATPAQFVAGLTDFGPGRAELFGNSKDSYLRVHSQGVAEANVTEGSAGIWERLHYDWADVNHVVLTTTDSNTWSNTSSHTYTLAPQPGGSTLITVDVVRDGKNLKGRLIGLLVSVVGRRLLEGQFRKTLTAIESRRGEVGGTATA